MRTTRELYVLNYMVSVFMYWTFLEERDHSGLGKDYVKRWDLGWILKGKGKNWGIAVWGLV